jgi:hypothetical protein
MESTALLSNAIGKFAEAISTADSGSNNADNTAKRQEIVKAIMDTTKAKDSYTKNFLRLRQSVPLLMHNLIWMPTKRNVNLLR